MKLITTIMVTLLIILSLKYSIITSYDQYGEMYGLELQYLHALYSVTEICATDDHEQCNRYVAELSVVAHEIANITCKKFNDFRKNICWRNTLNNLNQI